MSSVYLPRFAAAVLLLGFSAAAASAGSANSKVDFNRDVRPIFSEICFTCHGPDQNKRKAGLRLDIREEAIKAKVFIPGKSARSELYKRITTKDEDDVMPPADFRKQLTKPQIDILRRWIDQGAEYKSHWAYQKPERPPLPRVRHKSWVRNEIDRFILAKLEREGLKPAKEADKIKLIRRVTLDLTGLPPTPEEVDAFLADKRAEAYEYLVDRLLASPHFGERMAQFWLDAARFADTNGYHIDTHRDIWLWREWVINAFNKNMRFDQFTIEQLAGDLLPDATVDQKIASGFNRNEMVNFEGGADPNEYAVKYVVGRVDATSRTWLGTTMACAECHDHKYDPVSQKEYYQFFAFFNTIAEQGLDGQYEAPAPRMKVPSPEQQAKLEQFDKEIAAMEAKRKELLEQPNQSEDVAQLAWENGIAKNVLTNWLTLAPSGLSSTSGAMLTNVESDAILVSGTNATPETYEITLKTEFNDITGIRLETLQHESLPGTNSGRGDKGEFLLTGVEAEAINPSKEIKTVEPPVFGSWYSIGPFKAESQKEAFQKQFPPEKEVDLAKKYEEGKLEWTKQTNWNDGAIHELKGDVAATYLYRTITAKDAQQLFVSLGSDDGIQVWLNGRKLLAKDVARAVAPDQEKLRLRLAPGENKLLLKINNGGGGYAFYFNPLKEATTRYPIEFSAAVADRSKKDSSAANIIDDRKNTGWSVDEEKEPRPHQVFLLAQQPFGFEGGTELKIKLKFESADKPATLGHFRLGLTTSEGLTNFVAFPENVRAAFFASPEERTNTHRAALQAYYRENFVAEVKQHNEKLATNREARTKHEKSIPVTMVMKEMDKPRETHFLVRGDFQNKGEKVQPAAPLHLGFVAAEPATNRLALAKWLVDPNHPLTSRVIVNRFWQQYFGGGLVKTADDFGSQGDWPSHPELLDWLATKFIDSGWDIKAMQKLIVMSAAYRQSSAVDPGKFGRDPENRLLARGPRFRLDAETIRDQALAVSGLLNPQFGGPSVAPYQPPGLWEAIGFTDNGNFSAQKYVQSKGADNYRRGIYTYWKRSMPYASFVTFDAPSREVCTVKRPRTNTPLQALVLMNDPVYVEAARAFGERVLREQGGGTRDRLKYAFKLCLGRLPARKELETLETIYNQQLDNFRHDVEGARKFVEIGESKPPGGIDLSELAAWTAIGNVLFNLDEMITKG